MAPAPTVKTLSTTQTTIFGPDGKAQPIIRTKWMYGTNHGPYTTDIPVDEFNAVTLKTAQDKLVAELQKLPG